MAPPLSAQADFIRTHTLWKSVPYVPEVSLWSADEATAIWSKTEDDLGQIGLPPPFWAFPWAGGQALARYVLDNPDLVRGRRVLDVGAGSGLVAIAAAKAGAAQAIANDIDPYAHVAIALNAAGNGVTVHALDGDQCGRDEGYDVVLAGDISYERDMAHRLTAWMAGLAQRGALVLIGDPQRTYLDRNLLEPVATYDIPVLRDLEDADTKTTKVWRFRNQTSAEKPFG